MRGTDPEPLMSALGHKRTFDVPLQINEHCGWPAAMVSFEEFVNDGKKRLRKCQAERRRRLGIDGKLELGWLLDRNIARFCAAENFVHHIGGPSETDRRSRVRKTSDRLLRHSRHNS